MQLETREGGRVFYGSKASRTPRYVFAKHTPLRRGLSHESMLVQARQVLPVGQRSGAVVAWAQDSPPSDGLSLQ
jgi:hypothetical protein